MSKRIITSVLIYPNPGNVSIVITRERDFFDVSTGRLTRYYKCTSNEMPRMQRLLKRASQLSAGIALRIASNYAKS